MLQNWMKCHQVLSHQHYWELSTDTYLAFWNAIHCHIIQSIYYTIVKHLQCLTRPSFQHLHGLQLYLVKHSNDGWFFWFSCFVGKLALIFHRNVLLPSAGRLIINQVDFEVTGRKKCALSLTSVQINFQFLALKSHVHGTHSSHLLASVIQVGQNFQKPSCIADTFLLPVTVTLTWTRISHPEDGGTMFLWNVTIYIYCMVWQHRKGQSNGKIIVMKPENPYWSPF